MKMKGGLVRLSSKSTRIILLRQLQERLACKSTTRIEDSRSKRAARILRGYLLKSGLDAARLRHVGANSDGLAAAGVDFLDDSIIAGWGSG